MSLFNWFKDLLKVKKPKGHENCIPPWKCCSNWKNGSCVGRRTDPWKPW